MKTPQKGCPVCGYADFEALDENGENTWLICPSCGCESGYTYQKLLEENHLEKVRQAWLYQEKGSWWSDPDDPPEGWNPLEQMKKAGISIPKEEEKS